MIVPAALAQKTDSIERYVSYVSDRVRDILSQYCESQGYAFLGRRKQAESLTEKIESGRYERWEDIEDLYACSLVTPGLDHEEHVLSFLESRFDRIKVRARGAALKDPAVFRFDATRFVGRLRSDPLRTAGSPALEVCFEIQIRTAFEHAWCVATHDFAYKADAIDWRRSRLAAQMKANVEQLDHLVASMDSAIETIPPQKWPEFEAKEQIFRLFQNRFASGHLPEELKPHSWGRFCDNYYALVLSTGKRFLRDREKIDLVQTSLEVVDSALPPKSELEPPRSLTLLQYCIGLLLENDFIADGNLHRYHPLVTSELLTLFPKSACLCGVFEMDVAMS